MRLKTFKLFIVSIVLLLCNPIVAEEIVANKGNTYQDEILTLEELTDLYFEKGWTYSLLAALDSDHNLSNKLKLLSSEAAKARLELKRLKIKRSEVLKAASQNLETADTKLTAQLDDLASPRQSKIGIPFDTVLSDLEDQLATKKTLHSKLRQKKLTNFEDTLSVQSNFDTNLRELRNIQKERGKSLCCGAGENLSQTESSEGVLEGPIDCWL